MKGSIADCLAKLVSEKFGSDYWIKSLTSAGMSKYSIFLPFQDIDDNKVMELINSVCQTLNISSTTAAEAFGEYWVNTYAANIYKIYFMDVTTARDFLLKMDKVHEKVTKNIANAKPPRFNYTWNGRKKLLMEYKSPRGLLDIMVGLVKGVGTYYKEPLEVKKINNQTLEITFPA